MHHVQQARSCRKANGLCRNLSHRRYQVWRSRRVAGRSKKRIHDNPDTYLHHIFGETEVGGTSVLLLSSIGFNNFGFRNDLTERALPLYTYQVLSRIPDFVPLFGTLLGGIYWITHRREDVAVAEAQEKNDKGGAR
jgi:formate dehydrogenase iron-sulfur subunit